MDKGTGEIEKKTNTITMYVHCDLLISPSRQRLPGFRIRLSTKGASTCFLLLNVGFIYSCFILSRQMTKSLCFVDSTEALQSSFCFTLSIQFCESAVAVTSFRPFQKLLKSFQALTSTGHSLLLTSYQLFVMCCRSIKPSIYDLFGGKSKQRPCEWVRDGLIQQEEFLS